MRSTIEPSFRCSTTTFCGCMASPLGMSIFNSHRFAVFKVIVSPFGNLTIRGSKDKTFVTHSQRTLLHDKTKTTGAFGIILDLNRVQFVVSTCDDDSKGNDESSLCAAMEGPHFHSQDSAAPQNAKDRGSWHHPRSQAREIRFFDLREWSQRQR